MLRPERMSRVSVTGTKRVLSEVIETVHGLNVLHMTDYDDEWDGFKPGDPIAGADEAAEQLVTVRSLVSILGVEVDRETEGSADLDGMADRLETVREEANRLDDRRDELHDERAELTERADAMAPIETLGIDLDLLSGYDSLETRVGEADESAVREALEDASEIERYEIFGESGAVAVFAASDAAGALDDALTGVEFPGVEVPDAEGTPEEYLDSLDDRRADLDAEIEEVESDLADLRDEHTEFLLAAEEDLTVEVQRREAPLSFATTDNAFIAEGWIPTERYDDLENALSAAVGDHVAIEELERASYDSDGRVEEREPTESGGSSGGAGGATEEEVAADGGNARADGGERSQRDREPRRSVLRSDGGDIAIGNRAPPVVQDNPDTVQPFEVLVRTVSRPLYTEIDPSIVLFLTLPLMFGFMIGDVGYGLVYIVVGYLMLTRFESDGIRAVGAVGLWAGGFTALFGLAYGEIFGFHVITSVVWEGVFGLGGPLLEKGLMPATIDYANAWLLISVLFGVVHMAIGYVFDFVDNLTEGIRTAMLESGSYLVLMVGVWVWALSRTLTNVKPEFMFQVFNGKPFALGFAGFSPTVGWAALAVAIVVGLGLVMVNEVSHFGGVGLIVGFLEGLLRAGLVNPLSYTRLAAELIAEVGLAFAVNLLFFGAYEHGGEFHLLFNHGPGYVETLGGDASLMFPGLIHLGIVGVALGVVVLVVGHLLVLGVGVMSAGLQAIRLEYVEFFNQFYEGGGEQYQPFGYERTHTLDE